MTCSLQRKRRGSGPLQKCMGGLAVKDDEKDSRGSKVDRREEIERVARKTTAESLGKKRNKFCWETWQNSVHIKHQNFKKRGRVNLILRMGLERRKKPEGQFLQGSAGGEVLCTREGC